MERNPFSYYVLMQKEMMQGQNNKPGDVMCMSACRTLFNQIMSIFKILRPGFYPRQIFKTGDRERERANSDWKNRAESD